MNKINLYPKLERAGLRVHERSEQLVYKRARNERQDRIVIPKEVDAVLVLHDLMSHSIYNATKLAAELAGKKFVAITRHWARTQGYLKEAGLITQTIKEEDMATEVSLFERNTPTDTAEPKIELRVSPEYLLKPGETLASAGIKKNSDRYNALAAERYRVTKLFLQHGLYRDGVFKLTHRLRELGLGGADPRSWYKAMVELGLAQSRDKQWKHNQENRVKRDFKPRLLTVEKKREVTVPAAAGVTPAPVQPALKSVTSDKDRFQQLVIELRKVMKPLQIHSALIPLDGAVEVEIVTTASQSWKM